MKFRTAAPARLAYESEAESFVFSPKTFRFSVFLLDANWQTEGKNEINNNTNKRRGWRETSRGQRIKLQERKAENGSVTHQRSLIISWGTPEENKKFYQQPPSNPHYFSLLLSLQLIWSCFFAFFSSFFPPSPLEPDCGSCCLKTFGVESLKVICHPALQLQTRAGGRR